MSRKADRQGDVFDEEELGRARPSRDVMLSPRSGPLEELLHLNPPSCRSRTGVRTRVMTKGEETGCLFDVPLRETVGLRNVLI